MDAYELDNRFESERVTVHEYQVGKSTEDHSSNIITETPAFQVGSKLARDAVCRTGWKNKRYLNYEFTLQANACFIWAREPPRLSEQEKVVNRYKTLKSWGDPISEEEFVNLSELDNFEHTRQGEAPPSPPTKKIFSGSLHGVIAQPHFYSSVASVSTIPTDVPPYKKTKPIPITPYGDDVTQLLNPLSAFARTAWIIPVRGSLPWAFCTPAVVLDDSENYTPIEKEGALIQWKKSILAKFWEFLKNVREGGKVGQVGISLHVVTARERDGSLSADVIHEPSGSPAHGVNELQVWSLPLSSVDHVKIYHKASNAMSLRNILDAWAYIYPDGQKMRVLKGSKLVLVDERCRGILVS